MRTSKRILSIILSILTILNIMSCAVGVWAAEYNEPQSEDYMVGSSDEQLSDDAEIEEVTREVVEKREEYSKTYIHPNGSYTKVYSQTPIHMFEEGLWVDIDNTMAYEGGYLKNTDGLFDVEFPEVISEDSQIILNNNGETIAFSVNGIGAVEAMVTAPEVDETNVIEYDLSKTVSEITYENVSEHTDIQYVVSSGFVKENIIVSDKSGIKDTYSFEIDKGKLTAVLDGENNLNFINAVNEVVFTIPAPVMTDAAGAISYDVDVTVENAGQSVITMIYSPSQEWLNDSERIYPVVIDPVVALPDMDGSVIEDTDILYDLSDPQSRYTNYANSGTGVIENNQESHGEVLVKINLDTFSFCRNANIEVTDVNYFSAGYVNGGNILAKPINGSWDNSTIVYDDVYPEDNSTPLITYEDTVIDYFTGYSGKSKNAVTVHFNITGLFREWLSGERANDGFAIIPENEDTKGFLYLAGENTVWGDTYTFNTYCAVDYVDASGKNEVYESLTQEIGRAGSVNVNTFTRGLSAYRHDIGMSGNIMPVDVTFNYGGSFNSFLSLYKSLVELNGDEADVHMPYGTGWLPSYLRAIFTVIPGQYQVFVGDGTVAVFNSEYKTVDGVTTLQFDEDYTSTATGYELKLIDQSLGECTDNIVLVSPSGEKTYFDEYGFVTEIHEAEANTDGTYDKIMVVLDSDNLLCVDYITDGVGRKYDFIYDKESDMLSRIECLTASGEQINAGTTQKSLSVSYAYNLYGNLIEVIYPDDKYIRYDYENNNLVKATNIDGYGIEYTYDSLDKVTMITEYSGSVTGNSIMLVPLGNRQVKIIDAYSGTEIHQFGKDGRLHYIFDDKGNYYKTESAPATDDNIITANDWTVEPENLLKNGAFESFADGKPLSWNNAFSLTETDESGFACVVDGTAQQSQIVSVDGGKAYTFSVSAKSSEEDGVLDIQITAVTARGTSTVESEKIYPTDEYKQYSVTVLCDYEITGITVTIGGDNTTGEIYVDNAQLESGKGTADFNYIENGGFEYVTDNVPENWTDATVTAHTINGESVSAAVLEGGLPYYSTSENVQTLTDYKSEVSQRVEINGKKGDIYSVGGWFNGLFDDNYINPTFIVEHSSTTDQLTESRAYIEVSYQYTSATADADGNEVLEEMSETFTVDFAPHNDNWQYAVDSFALKGDVEYIDIKVISKNIPTTSYATNISVTKDMKSELIEEGTTDEESSEDICSCACEDCAYGENCPCTGAINGECQCYECLRKVTTTKDNWGNVLSNKSVNGAAYIETLSSFTADGNYMVSYTDETGNVTTYDYNQLNGLLESVISPMGEGTDTTTTSYEYDEMGNIVSVSTTGDAATGELTYVYTNDRLTEIITTNGKYRIVYDCWGQVLSVNIVVIDNGRETDVPLIQYMYGVGEKRAQVTTVTYTNSSTNKNVYRYTYDENGSVVGISVNHSDKHIISYDNLGSLTRIENVGGRTVSYSDDGVTIYDDEGELVYQSLVSEDGDFTEENHGFEYTDIEGESSYDVMTGTSTQTGGIEYADTKRMEQSVVTDWFGRDISHSTSVFDTTDEVQEERDETTGEITVAGVPATEIGKITTDYEYYGFSDGKTTSNIENYVNKVYSGSVVSYLDGYRYEYDGQNRVVAEQSIDINGAADDRYSYEYDSLGQVVRYNDAVKNRTYIYTYDNNGNVLTKTAYLYTTGDNLGEALDVVTYNYDEQWNDRLVGVGDLGITYDSIGNPVQYMGATLTWEGRNLTSYETDTVLIQYEYDENGMRYRSTITTKETGEASTYEYVWSDGKLISIVFTGGDLKYTAKYLYGDLGEPVGMVVYDGESTITYLFTKNMHGDITRIVTANGTLIVSYTYDMHGNRTATYNSDTSNPLGVLLRIYQMVISSMNPFGYRGYCYDANTGLYYLQSRYYDPNTGRFINADSTDYLNVSGTVLGCNLFIYCENDPVNNVDPTGCYGISNLLSVFSKSIDLLKSILEMISNSCLNDLKNFKSTIKNLTKKQKNYYKLIDDVSKQADKLSNKLGTIGKIISFITIVVTFIETINSGAKKVFVLAKLLVELATEALISGASKICGWIAKKVPGVGFVLNVLVSIGVSYLLSRYFTDKRISLFADKVHYKLKNSKSITANWLYKTLFRTLFA